MKVIEAIEAAIAEKAGRDYYGDGELKLRLLLEENAEKIVTLAKCVEAALCDQEDNYSGPDFPELRDLHAAWCNLNQELKS